MKQRMYRWALTLVTMNNWILYGLLFALFFAKAFFTLDPDFGWHLSSGEYILQHGIPSHDIYSYTASNFSWIHHEWLADTIGAMVYHLVGGFTVLAVLYALLWTVAIWLVARTTKARLLVLFVGVTMVPFSGVRAITWTIVFSAVMIAIYRAKDTRLRAVLPFLILLWANMHGSFVVGLAYIGWQLARDRTTASLGVFVMSVLASCVTPYGPGMYVEIVRTMFDTTLRSRIQEWRSFGVKVDIGIVVGVWAGLLIIAKGAWWRKFLRFESLLAIMMLSSVRHAPVFALFALATIVEQLQSLVIPVQTLRDRGAKKMVVALVMLSVVACVLFSYFALRYVSIDREQPYPQTIAGYLRQHPCEGNVFAEYNYGGYLIWKVPSQKLYIDGRMPSWRLGDKSYMDDYIRVLNDTDFQRQEFQRYDIRCAVVRPSLQIAKQLQESGWRIVSREEGNTIVLYER